jgi:archaeal flagellin FlaB
MNNKRAEMGVGTLIIFIAMLLVAAVAAGVLIQTAGSLQEKSLSTGQQARSQISTNARIIEVSGTDGRNGNLTDFQEILKLSPGSDAIKLDQVIFTFNTKDKTSTLKYRGVGGICEQNNTIGYNTLRIEEIDSDVDNSANSYMLADDLDDDGIDDYLRLIGETNVEFTLSSAGTINATIDSGNFSEVGSVISATNALVSNVSDSFAYISMSGTIATGDEFPSNGTFTVTPYNEGEGYFIAIYEQTGTNHVEGNLQRGDIIRFCFEAPSEIQEDEEVRLNFIPKIGTPTLTQFVSPDVISTQRVYLYP